jgi:hypothetical protein
MIFYEKYIKILQVKVISLEKNKGKKVKMIIKHLENK